MADARAGGALSFKLVGFGWALMLAGGMYFWMGSHQGVGGPAFAMLTRTALVIGAFRISRGINSGRITRPRSRAWLYLAAVLIITWLGIAASASPNSSAGFLSIPSLYGREPNAFVPEFRQSVGHLYGEVMFFVLALVFLFSLIALIRARPAV